MVQVVRIKRNVTSATVPPSLDPGELAYNKANQALYVGDDTNTVVNLVNSTRQVELTGNQGPITGVKTFGPTGTVALNGIANLLAPGGNAGELVTTDGAGNLSFSPALTASQQFVGSAKGDTGAVQLTTVAGGGTVLPAPAPANNGWYVIYDVAGATKPPNSGAGVTGPFNIGDWLISNGTAWTHLAYGGISSVTAADVGVAPVVAGGDDVQEVLENLATAQGNFVVGPAVAINNNFAAFDTTTGKLIKDSTYSYTSLQAAAKTYVDAANAAQDTAQDAVDAAQDALIAANAAAILTKGDVVGPAIAVDTNLAVFDGTTGKLIADGGIAVAALATQAAVDAADALRVLKAGDTMTGPLVVPLLPTLAGHATSKQYVDDGLASVAAGASVLVTGPELTGNGLLGTEITFNGITIAANSATSLVGNGLSATGLDLVLVDGGTWV